MDFITGRHGQNHVTSAQFRAIIESLAGSGSYIAPLGNQLSMELAANNTVNINSGMLFHHGGVFEVKDGTYDTATYNNGTQGMKRIDLLVARYSMNAEGIESAEWVIIQGEPHATNPIAPEYIMGNMQSGDTVEDCPVAEIRFDGINATEVAYLLDVLTANHTMHEMMREMVQELASELSVLKENLGGCAIRTQTVVRYVQGEARLPLFTVAELREMFGAPSNTSTNHFAAFLMNGDRAGTTAHVPNATWEGTTLYAEFNLPFRGNVRLNYMIVYRPWEEGK